jgi:hypothetical protein
MRAEGGRAGTRIYVQYMHMYMHLVAVGKRMGVTFYRILPQILGSLPEVIRSCCHHHHHHHQKGLFARPFGVERSLIHALKPEPSGGRPWEAAFGQRHPSRPASRRSITRSTI